MKTYFKHVFLLFTFIGLVACNTTSDKKETLEKEIDKIEKNLESKTTKEPVMKQNTSETSPEKDKQTTFMSSEMKDWKPVPQNMWLQQNFIDNYNTTFGIEEKIDYTKNTSIKGDFNGDGFSDFAQFLQNSKNEVVLMAFHQTENGYKAFEVSKLGTITQCCLGAGISVTPPGIYTNLETTNDRTIESDAIIYSIYEKSDSIWYFDGKKYSSFFISD